MEDRQTTFITSRSLTETKAFLVTELSTTDHLKPLVVSIRSAANDVHRRRSKSSNDVGFEQNYLDNYIWFNLIAPSGPFISDSLWLSIGFWEQGLHYPRHWHKPEEIYLTVRGSAIYVSEGCASVESGPGTTICHYSNQPHAVDFSKAPLLAAAFRCGKGLEAKSQL